MRQSNEGPLPNAAHLIGVRRLPAYSQEADEGSKWQSISQSSRQMVSANMSRDKIPRLRCSAVAADTLLQLLDPHRRDTIRPALHRVGRIAHPDHRIGSASPIRPSHCRYESSVLAQALLASAMATVAAH